MKANRLLMTAWTNLKQRKLRATLTTLGVVIGITAIIGIASLGEGFRLEIRQRMQTGFELDNLTIIPGSLFGGMSDRFTDGNVRDILDVSGVKAATGVKQLGNVTLYNGNASVQAFVATAVNFSEFVETFSDRFVFENAPPASYSNDTMVIGHKINHPSEDGTTTFAIAGDNVTLEMMFSPLLSRNYTFSVGGTLQKKGTPGITNFDYWAFIPLERAREIFEGSSKSQELDLIFVKVDDPAESEKIADDIEALFPPYRITVLAPLTFIKQVDNILGIIQIFLMAIASISLLVAGIGIMNIMTVSVMERTREIGILKAIGAKSSTVLMMFLGEAMLVGVIGGVIGVFTGYGLSFGLAYVLSSNLIQPQENLIFQNPENTRLAITPVFSPEWTLIAFIFSIAICIIFGLYPARKASKLNPVEALRYE